MGDTKDVGAMPGSRASGYTGRRVLERIERLAREGLDVATFLSEAGAALERAVPSGTENAPSPSWVTLDPASLLVTSLVYEGCEISLSEWARFEYSSGMVGNRIGDVVRHPRGVQTARELVEADPDGGREYLDLMTSIGVEHEVLVDLRTRRGGALGCLLPRPRARQARLLRRGTRLPSAGCSPSRRGGTHWPAVG